MKKQKSKGEGSPRVCGTAASAHLRGGRRMAAPLIKKHCLCSVVLHLFLCQRSFDCVYVGVFVGSSFCSLICLFIHLSIPQCLYCCSIVVGLEVGQCQSHNFVLLQNCVACSGSFASLYDFKISCYYPQNNLWGFFFKFKHR